MKKTMTAMMAAAMISTTGTALAATPDRGGCWNNTPCYETNYDCGGGYCGGGRGGRGGYGCGGGYGGGYCWDNGNSEG